MFGPLAVAVAFAAACGSTSADGGAREGGQGGAGGSDGAPPGNCLQRAGADCPTIDGCHLPADAGAPSHLCFAGGVEADYSFTGNCGGTAQVLMNVYKPDGTLCYSYHAAFGPICESSNATWTDGSGHVIASSESSTTFPSTFRCVSGEPVDCTTSPCSLGSGYPATECQPGPQPGECP